MEPNIISLDLLSYYCGLPTEKLLENKDFRFIDNKANILGVAHCDYVNIGYKFKTYGTDDDFCVFCPRLDDRLGVYLLMEVMHKMGINYDILLTDNEERGSSTASLFSTDKKYNWIFEVDRRGYGAVTYCYTEMEKPLEEFMPIAHGTFSDISLLDWLGIGAFNLAVGYEHEHTEGCYATSDVLFKNLENFKRFYDKHKDTPFIHKYTQPTFGYKAYNSVYSSGGASTWSPFYNSTSDPNGFRKYSSKPKITGYGLYDNDGYGNSSSNDGFSSHGYNYDSDIVKYNETDNTFYTNDSDVSDINKDMQHIDKIMDPEPQINFSEKDKKYYRYAFTKAMVALHMCPHNVDVVQLEQAENKHDVVLNTCTNCELCYVCNIVNYIDSYESYGSEQSSILNWQSNAPYDDNDPLRSVDDVSIGELNCFYEELVMPNLVTIKSDKELNKALWKLEQSPIVWNIVFKTIPKNIGTRLYKFIKQHNYTKAVNCCNELLKTNFNRVYYHVMLDWIMYQKEYSDIYKIECETVE